MKKQDGKVLVSSIKEGVVLDHIPTSCVFKILEVLELDKFGEEVLVGNNFSSSKIGLKGIIKISGRVLNSLEKNKISLLARGATMCEIKDFKVLTKEEIKLQSEVVKVVKCFNPNCITNFEPIETNFRVVDFNQLKLKCKYCEKVTLGDEIKFK